jgi:DNA processing protein
MPPDQELRAWLALALTPGLGPAAFRDLLAQFGGPEAICAASPGALKQVVAAETVQAIQSGPQDGRVETALRWLEDPANHVVTLADATYPHLLLQTADPPPLLYVKGDLALLNRPALAIIGSRSASRQGTANAEAFARELSDSGFTIVSGLALGIDAAAHRGGLAGKEASIAVVGTGLDIVYPARNRDLAHQLSAGGALVSEYALATPPMAMNFPRRNRLLSGLSSGCLVVEAALQSGSLITAGYALEQGREVFAIPGSIHSTLSKGCHRLIKQGAKLVESAADILEELGAIPRAAQPVDPVPVSAEHQPLLDALGFDPVDLDTLCERGGLTAETASAMLLTLELDGLVNRLPGGKFQRVR